MGGVILFIGDSITAGTTGADRGKGLHYLGMVEKHFRDSGTPVLCINHGIPSAKTPDFVPAVGIPTPAYFAECDPDITIILLGSNDAAYVAGSEATVQSNLEAIVDAVKSRKRRGLGLIYICTLIPRNGVALATFNAAVQAAATAKNVPVIDTHAAFAEADVNANTVDGTHPNDAGAAKVADVIWAALNAAGVPALLAGRQ